MAEETPLILVVDDDPNARGYFERLMSLEGYRVSTADSGRSASALLDTHRFDVILSDISMPGMTGIELLEAVRGRDLDVPVILVTGNPNVDSAARAVQHGAFRYLIKPVQGDKLREAVAVALKLGVATRQKRLALEQLGRGGGGDLAGLEVSFQRALDKLWMAFQPIVSSARRGVYAYEALVRSEEKALPHPGSLLDAAVQLDRLFELGRTIRAHVARAIGMCTGDAVFFVNLHPRDLTDDTLYSLDAPLSRFAGRIVLEITERAHLDEVEELDARLAELRKMGFRIALDDLGAGYSGLNSLVRLSPDVVKIDMELVQGVHADRTRSELVRSVMSLCQALSIDVVAEGVEAQDDHAALLSLGVDLLQGYAFARPTRELALVPRERFLPS